MIASELTPYHALSYSSDHEPAQLDQEEAMALQTTSAAPLIMPFRDVSLFEDISYGQGFALPSLVTDMVASGAPPALPATPSRSFNLDAISAELDANLSYAVAEIKSAPRSMLLELQTPWCHACLYKEEMPRVMQGQCHCVPRTLIRLTVHVLDALSACALYTSRNSANGSIIMRCIDAKVNDLLASHIPADFLNTVAHVQALLLYQTIRFFDSDILARSSADATFHELKSAAHALASHIEWNPHNVLDDSKANGEINLFPLQASRAIWKQWVLQESARRTFLIACFFVNVWKLLTGRQVATCRADPVLLGQSWTLSAKLWQAGNAVDFAVAWRGRDHFVVRRRAIISTLANARGDDIETFGKMLLTVSMGVEEARAWLALKGAAL